ncbi:hypothetical protein [Spirillospora sp. NPDC047279]|uniref:hypothetical protein n=1 Tax=Spirillospora sp. NPDC047279 TaxID=3155478 RepID=UPI0033F799B9
MTDWDEGALAVLRGAASLRDGAAGVEVLRTRPLEPVLQYAGDVLAAALARRVPEARPLAEKCLQALNARGEAGDAELAAVLAEALGAGTGAGLTEVPVDLGELAGALSGRLGPGPFVVDLRHGDVLPAGEAESFDAGDPGYDPDRWVGVTPDGRAPAGEERERGLARRWLAAYGLRPGPRAL